MRKWWTVVVVAAVLLVGCSSSSKKTGSTASTSTTSASGRTLEILVTNDDGVAAPGIDALAVALTALPHVHVTVVAPAANNSGAGGAVTNGALTVTDSHTASGLAAHAVAGTPADTIRAALDQLSLHPDVVVSGINAGQNLGLAADLSGTVGAARAAVARKLPALAISSGLGTGAATDTSFDFAAAAPFATAWITQHRAALLGHTATVEVTSINVPTCTAGKVRGLDSVPADLNKADLGSSLRAQDCTSTATGFADDVNAFVNGYATSSILPAHAAS